VQKTQDQKSQASC